MSDIIESLKEPKSSDASVLSLYKLLPSIARTDDMNKEMNISASKLASRKAMPMHLMMILNSRSFLKNLNILRILNELRINKFYPDLILRHSCITDIRRQKIS
jgi:hypothetical protein